MAELVETQERLQEVCDRLVTEPVVALDTEFLWRNTYRPILGLVQIATQDASAWLVDPLAIEDISPLAAVLECESVVKILHDAKQDIAIILQNVSGEGHLCKPKNIFDTRLAAGFTPLGATLSLKNLLERTLGVSLAKTETCSDWTRRPLSPKQLAYAADDVIYLPRLREYLLALSKIPQTKQWMLEEMEKFDNPRLYAERDALEAWKHVKGTVNAAWKLSPAKRAHFLSVLRQIAAWREETARKRNRPVRRLYEDFDLLEAAQNPDRLLGPIANAVALANPPEDAPYLLPASERFSLKDRCDAILAKVAITAKKAEIDSGVVVSRSQLENCFVFGEPLPTGNGWRAELLQ